MTRLVKSDESNNVFFICLTLYDSKRQKKTEKGQPVWSSKATFQCHCLWSANHQSVSLWVSTLHFLFSCINNQHPFNSWYCSFCFQRTDSVKCAILMRNPLSVPRSLVCNHTEAVATKGGHGAFNEKKKNKFLELCHFSLGTSIINKMG